MFKTFVGLALLVSASPLLGAGTGPEIAYVKAGTHDAIYLVNPDGSGLRLLYTSGRRMRIFALDMKPGGGELAFEEVSATGSANATLKVVRYDHAGTLQSTSTLAVCRLLSIDYHPSGSDLLFHDSCAGARRLNTTTMTSTAVAVPAGVNKVSWRGSAELLYNRSTAEASQMLLAPIASPSSATIVGQVRLARSMDVSSSGAAVLVDPTDFGSLSLFNMSSGTEQKDWQIGHFGRFSPDDLRVVYASGFDVRGSYLFIRRTDGLGTPFRLASKGPFGPVDWRN